MTKEFFSTAYLKGWHSVSITGSRHESNPYELNTKEYNQWFEGCTAHEDVIRERSE